jgi:hypothetical protein
MSEANTYFYFFLKKPLRITSLRAAFADFSQKLTASTSFQIAEYTIDYSSPNDVLMLQPQNIEDTMNKEFNMVEDAGITQLDFYFMLNNDMTQTLHLSLEVSYRIALFSVAYSLFKVQDTVLELIQFSKAFYNSFQPLYGYGPTEPADFPQATIVDNAKIVALYSYNFLGPDIVSSYGAEQLYSIDAWRIEDLSRGGMFIAMEPNPYTPEWQKYRENYEKVAQTLGLSRFQQGG